MLVVMSLLKQCGALLEYHHVQAVTQTDFCVTNAVQTEAEFYAEVLAYTRELRVFSTFRLRVSDSLGLHCLLGVGVEFIYFLFRKVYESIE